MVKCTDPSFVARAEVKKSRLPDRTTPRIYNLLWLNQHQIQEQHFQLLEHYHRRWSCNPLAYSHPGAPAHPRIVASPWKVVILSRSAEQQCSALIYASPKQPKLSSRSRTRGLGVANSWSKNWSSNPSLSTDPNSCDALKTQVIHPKWSCRWCAMINQLKTSPNVWSLKRWQDLHHSSTRTQRHPVVS